MNNAIIVAFDENRTIGVNNTIPWCIPSDLRNFKKLTLNQTVIMGRKTFESIGKPLPKRRNIVLTSSDDLIEGVDIFHRAENLLVNMPKDGVNYIIGGSSIYSYFLPYCDTLYISHVKTGGKIKGDVFFPEFDIDQFNIAYEEEIFEDKDEFPYTFKEYRRKSYYSH